MNYLSDQILIDQLKQGRPAAVREWWQRFQPVVSQYVLVKISSPADAEEIVQQTFINCLKHLNLFAGRSAIKTWMLSIARHEVADYYRKKYAKKALQVLPLHQLILDQESRPVDADQLAEQVTTKVKQVLARMRKDYRELLLLKYVDGKQVKLIATEWNRTVKSVEADLFRARQDFRELYATITD